MTPEPSESAWVFGVGPGLGMAVARRCAHAGMRVAVVARDADRLEASLPELRDAGAPDARAYPCDVAREESVETTFRQAGEALGPPRLVVFNAGAFTPRGLLATASEEFEHSWRVGCYGGFLVGRAAVRAMLAATPDAEGRQGTILLTGATASLRGSAGFHNLAVGKFGLRALAQSMAREFHSQGIHVAHVVIDGKIAARAGTDDSGEELDPAAIAETYWQLHRQPRSAWTHEVDLRPWSEPF